MIFLCIALSLHVPDVYAKSENGNEDYLAIFSVTSMTDKEYIYIYIYIWGGNPRQLYLF